MNMELVHLVNNVLFYIIDQIDQGLAKHYGFTDEDLDFIINYDIKCRMGRGAEGEGEDG